MIKTNHLGILTPFLLKSSLLKHSISNLNLLSLRSPQNLVNRSKLPFNSFFTSLFSSFRSIYYNDCIVPLVGIKLPYGITLQVMTGLKWLFHDYFRKWCQDDSWRMQTMILTSISFVFCHAEDNFCSIEVLYSARVMYYF